MGVKTIDEALKLADFQGLDLVEIAPSAQPPVCKIISYSKFLYQEEQKIKAMKNTKSDLKEIRLTPRIEEHDINTKLNQIMKFLTQGHKVKISMLLKGREVSKPEQGRKIIDSIIDRVKEVGEIQAPPSKDGRGIFLTIHPKKK